MSREPAKEKQETASNNLPRVRGLIRLLARLCKYTLLAILLLIIIAGGAAFWLTQTQNGQDWLLARLNPVLALKPGAEGTGIRITSLSGSIPVDFVFSIEASDREGIWLQAPDNRFVWDWRALPGKLHISQISSPSINIERFPASQNKEQTAVEKPYTLAEFQEQLQAIAHFLGEKHWWLPEIAVDQISASALLPQDILPARDARRLKVDAALAASLVASNASLDVNINAASESGSPLTFPSLNFSGLNAALKLTGNPTTDGIAARTQFTARIKSPELEVKDLPKDLLGKEILISMDLDMAANTGEDDPGLMLKLKGPGLEAGNLNIAGSGSWQSDERWKQGIIAGPLVYTLKMGVEPIPLSDSPLSAIRTPIDLELDAKGNFPKLTADLLLKCSEISHAGHKIENTSISISAPAFDIPLSQDAIEALENENTITLRFGADLDGHKATLAGDFFLQNLPYRDKRIWRAGMRSLDLDALGIAANGSLAALLAPGEKPLLDGDIRLGADSWKALALFLPGYDLTGSASIAVAARSGLDGPAANPASRIDQGDLDVLLPQDQKANLEFDIARLALSAKKESLLQLGSLKGSASMSSIFQDPALETSLAANGISTQGLKLNATASAAGKISGPLQLDVASSGSIKSKVAAQWRPGEVRLGTLNIEADLSAFLKKGKNISAGIRSAQPAVLQYGDKGIRISDLDLRMNPTGHLKASGGFAPDKMDLSIDLNELSFRPLQSLVPQLPSGAASLKANLSGTPNRPAGHFRLELKNINFPKNPVPPISLALVGDVIHSAKGSALQAKLDIDPQTIKALGGETAQISASIPLLFGMDGVPGPDMKGPLQAHVRWAGALGPVWNLVPIPDCRLNGRVDIDMNAGGTMTKPEFRGAASIHKARFEDVLFGILLTDINLDLRLADAGLPQKGKSSPLPGSMTLALSLSDGRGGTITASGKGSLAGENLDINARINKLRPLRRRDIHIELSGNAHVGGSAVSPAISGEIIVDKGEVLLNNLDFMASVTTLPITDAAQAKKIRQSPAPAAPAPDGNLNVRVIMRPRFTVEGRGLTSIWKANLLVTGPLDNPQVTGNIESVRGNFDFLGKIFALSKGIVFFGGGSISNPLVDIDLTHETPDLTAHILITGPVNKIRLRMTSDPSIPRDEIISRVLFGRSVNDLSRMEALQLAAAVAQLAGFGGGTSILSSAKKALGVDVLRIGTGDSKAPDQTNEDTGGGTTIEMGKYINDYIYMGVQQGFGADSTAFIIEIEISPRASFELRTEQSNTWGGFRWKYNY